MKKRSQSSLAVCFILVLLSVLVSQNAFSQDWALTGHIGSVNVVAFSPDGKLIASGSVDGAAILWDLHTRTPKLKLKATNSLAVISIAFSKDGKTLMTGGGDGLMILWDVQTGESKWVIDGMPKKKDIKDKVEGSISMDRLGSFLGFVRVTSIAFSPDGKTLAIGTEDSGPFREGTSSVNLNGWHDVNLWDMQTKTQTGRLTRHRDYVTSIAFSPDGKTLASGSKDTTILLWDVNTGNPKGRLMDHNDRVNSVAFSHNGKILATGSDDKTIKLWDVETGALKLKLKGDNRGIEIAFSPDDKTLVSGGDDKTMKLWDVETGTLKGTLLVPKNNINSITFSPDGKTVASGCRDKTVRLWSIR